MEGGGVKGDLVRRADYCTLVHEDVEEVGVQGCLGRRSKGGSLELFDEPLHALAVLRVDPDLMGGQLHQGAVFGQLALGGKEGQGLGKRGGGEAQAAA